MSSRFHSQLLDHPWMNDKMKDIRVTPPLFPPREKLITYQYGWTVSPHFLHSTKLRSYLQSGS